MDKYKPAKALILLVFMVSVAYAQDTAGPREKRARTPEDYQTRTMKELAAKVVSSDSRGNKADTMIVDPDISPSRVTATYAGLTRGMPERNREVVNQWSRLYAGSLDTYKPYEVDVLFSENGSRYWLTFKKKLLTSFWDSRMSHKPVDLFLIRMGAARNSKGDWEPVFLVEDFKTAK